MHNGGIVPRPEIAIAIARLLSLRLRWYALSTARLLLRRWQALALIVGLLAAAGTTAFDNMRMFSAPILAVVDTGHGFAWRSGHLLALQLFAALWAHMQREQITGGAFMAYAGSLPFSPRQRRRVDLAVLVLADSPLLVAVGMALAVVAFRKGGAAHALSIVDVGLLALATQLAVLDRRATGWAGVGLACLLLAAGVGTRFEPAAGLAIGAAAWLLLRSPPTRAGARLPAWLRAHARIRAWPVRRLALLAGPHAPALQVSLAILYRQRRNEVLAKTLILLPVPAVAWLLLAAFDDDSRSFVVTMIAQALVALTVSGLYRGLDMAHRASLEFTGALPLKGAWWRSFDHMAVLSFGLPWLAALASLAWLAQAAPARVLAALLSSCLLLAALRPVALFNERHAVVLSTLVAGCWCVATALTLI